MLPSCGFHGVSTRIGHQSRPSRSLAVRDIRMYFWYVSSPNEASRFRSMLVHSHPGNPILITSPPITIHTMHQTTSGPDSFAVLVPACMQSDEDDQKRKHESLCQLVSDDHAQCEIRSLQTPKIVSDLHERVTVSHPSLSIQQVREIVSSQRGPWD